MRRPALLSLAAASALLAGCADAETISRAELASRLASGTAPVVVDVRSDAEFRAGHLPGALHLPFGSAVSRAGEIPGPRSAPVVLYCEHGPRAHLAKLGLRLRGFENLVLLEGHMKAWREDGLPIETPPAPPAAADGG